MDLPSVVPTLPYPIKQFSIFTENKVGRLSDIIRLLALHHVHVLALTILDTTDSAIVRLVVDDPETTRDLLAEHAIAYAESLILAVEISGEHDIDRVLAALLETEINVHYIYSFVSRPMGRSALALSIEDIDVAVHIFNTRNIKVLTQRDLSR